MPWLDSWAPYRFKNTSYVPSSPTSIMPGRMDGLLDTVRGLPRDSGTKIVILVRSAKDADIVATFLSGMGYPTTSMHGDRQHSLREEAFNDFKSGRFPIITSTEIKQLAEATKIAHHIINFN
jgi:superfamily II DNA/RNA helicase